MGKQLGLLATFILAFGLSIGSLLAQTNSPGHALMFNGTNQDVIVSNQPSLNAFPITVTCWFNASTNTISEAGLVNKYPAGSLDGYQIFILNKHLMAWYLCPNSVELTPNIALNAGVVNDGKWHHTAFSVDASGARLYLDGVLMDVESWSGVPAVTTTTQPLYLGYYPDPGEGGYFSGLLDEVSIWDAALSQSQIQFYMNRSLAGNEPNLVAYYRFDEGSGVTTADASGYGQSGLLEGQPTWTVSGAAVGIVPPVEVYSNGWTKIPATYAENDAASADGLTIIKLTSSSPGSALSTNGGVTFAPTGLPLGYWDRIATTTDGRIVYVSASSVQTNIFVSTDSSRTWSPLTNLFASDWCVACSADGTTLLAASQGGDRAISRDSGNSWTSQNIPGTSWHYTSCSADGSKMIAAAYTHLEYSTNGGTNWQTSGFTFNNGFPAGFAVSADGSKLLSGSFYPGGPLYHSIDFGATWQPILNLPTNQWYGFASSADGSKLIASGFPDFFVSTDFGQTWQDTFAGATGYPAQPVISSDGTRSFIGCYNGNAFISLSPPALRALPSPGSIGMVAWPSPSIGFNLQQSSDFLSWTNTPAHPSVISSANQVIVTNSGKTFYRLQFP